MSSINYCRQDLYYNDTMLEQYSAKGFGGIYLVVIAAMLFLDSISEANNILKSS